MKETLLFKNLDPKKGYTFSKGDDGYFCSFGGAMIALPQDMQVMLFRDLLRQAGYKPTKDSLVFNSGDNSDRQDWQ